MKIISILIFAFSIFTTSAQENCFTEENLKKLDASWEKAQLELDFDFVDLLLAKDFMWVHNHAKTIDDKAAVLQRIKRYLKKNNKSTKSRTSKDVKVTIFGSTGIVSGYTIIERNSKLVIPC